jgi:hypothetical protein
MSEYSSATSYPLPCTINQPSSNKRSEIKVKTTGNRKKQIRSSAISISTEEEAEGIYVLRNEQIDIPPPPPIGTR